MGGGGRTAILFGDTVWSYAELNDRANRIARVLTEDMGVVPGHRVLLRAPNNPMLAAAWLAVLKTGAVCVATMPLLRARELAFIIDKARIHHAMCDQSLADELASGAGGRAIAGAGALLHRDRHGQRRSRHRTGRKTVGLHGRRYRRRRSGADRVYLGHHRPAEGHGAFPPRRAGHVRLLSPGMCSMPSPATTSIPVRRRWRSRSGLARCYAFPLRFGAAVALIDKPSPDALLETIERHRCTALYTAPTMYRALSERTRRRRSVEPRPNAFPPASICRKPVYEELARRDRPQDHRRYRRHRDDPYFHFGGRR